MLGGVLIFARLGGSEVWPVFMLIAKITVGVLAYPLALKLLFPIQMGESLAALKGLR